MLLAKIVLLALLAHEHTGLSLVTRGRMGRLAVSTQHIYTHQPYSLGPDAFYCGLFFSAIGTAHTLMEGTQQTEGRQGWFTIHFSHRCRGEVARQKKLKGSILSTLRLAMLLLQWINDKSAFFELFYIPQRCQRRFCWRWDTWDNQFPVKCWDHEWDLIIQRSSIMEVAVGDSGPPQTRHIVDSRRTTSAQILPLIAFCHHDHGVAWKYLVVDWERPFCREVYSHSWFWRKMWLCKKKERTGWGWCLVGGWQCQKSSGVMQLKCTILSLINVCYSAIISYLCKPTVKISML